MTADNLLFHGPRGERLEWTDNEGNPHTAPVIARFFDGVRGEMVVVREDYENEYNCIAFRYIVISVAEGDVLS